MKAMCEHEVMSVLPKIFPKKKPRDPSSPDSQKKMNQLPKGKTVDTKTPVAIKLIYMDFTF